MDLVNNLGERFIVPLAGFLNGNRYLKAIKSGLTMLSPLFLAAGLFLLLSFPATQHSDFSGWGTVGNFFELWKMLVTANLHTFLLPVNLIVGLCSVWIAIAVAYQLSGYYKMSQPLYGLLSGAIMILYAAPEHVVVVMKLSAKAFMRDVPFALTPEGLAGAHGVLPALVVAILTVEAARMVEKLAAKPKLPPSIPPAVLPAILSILSAGVTLILMLILNEICHVFFDLSFAGCAWFVLEPLLLVVGSLPFVLLMVFIAQWTWFLGMHGCNTMSHIFTPFAAAFILLNAELVVNGQAPVYAFTDPFWTVAVILGGNGATLGLVIVARLFARSAHLRDAAKRAIGSVTFNINELVVFGFPVIQSRRLMLPYILVPVINSAIMYICISAGMVRGAFCLVPWVVPAPLAAFLSTLDYRAFLLVCGLVVLDGLLYLPFLLKYDRELLAGESE